MESSIFQNKISQSVSLIKIGKFNGVQSKSILHKEPCQSDGIQGLSSETGDSG